jgi:Holliday junction resolvase RusA-like endonuclease
MITIFVPGTPVAQSRPRFARRGSFVTTYDAAPTKDYKSWVKSCAVDAMKQAGVSIIGRDVPLSLTVVVGLQRPKSRSKKYTQPTTKPDCDNVLKGLQDAMESIVYEADQQIVAISVRKRYVEAPGVIITIQEDKE